MIFATIEHYGSYTTRLYMLARNGVFDVTVSTKDETIVQLRKWLDVATRTTTTTKGTCIMRNPDRKRLTDVEHAMLNAINANPGLTPIELHPHAQALGTIKPTSISAITSRLVRLKKVNRLKVPMSSTYRYYPKDALLPEGHTEWHNKLVRVDRSKGRNGNSDKSIVLPPAPNEGEALAKAAQLALSFEDPADDVLITIPIGKNQSMTVTIAQARKIYAQLHAIFGGK